jgi:gliding motility-associated-like protein
VNVSGGLTMFASCFGTSSTQQSFTVSGSNLISNIIITAAAGFELSSTSGSGFTSSLSLLPNSGLISNTTIFIRLASSATGTPSGNISIESLGASSQTLSAAGVINNTITNNTIASSQSICSGATPEQLIGSIPTGGNGLTYNYVWQSSTTSATTGFTDAANPNTTINYQPKLLSQTTWFRRVVTSGLCASDNSPAVMISVNSLPVIASITGTQQLCVGLTTTFTSATTGGVWSSSNNAIATVNNNGVINAISAGKATITFAVTNTSGCTSAVTRDITVNGLPTVTLISGAQQVCIGLTTSFASTTTGGVWSSSNNAIATVNTNGVVSGIGAGTATISYTVTNANGCTSTVKKDVTVNSLPIVAALTGTQQVCFGSSTSFTSTTVGGVWGSNNTNAAPVDAAGIITGRQVGTATISYTVTSTSGCVSVVTRDITVNSLPLITATAYPTEVFKGQTAQLNVSAVGNIASFVWSPNGVTVTTNPASTTVRVTQNTTYTVTATTTDGCIASANVAITTKEEVFLEPVNVFTPNGDGVNDRFVIKNLDLYPKNKLQVFDRTGKIIYEKDSYANNWDGTVNGKLLTKDTYFYVLHVNGKIVRKATITILR